MDGADADHASQLGLGTYQVTVDAHRRGGDSVTGISAPDSFFFGLYPAVTVAASTTTLSYSQPSVTLTGQVTAYSPDGALEGVPDQPVSITDSDGGSWSATTDQNGDYSADRHAGPGERQRPGRIAHCFGRQQSAIAQASSPGLELTGEVDPVQVTVSLSKSVADFGTPVTLSAPRARVGWHLASAGRLHHRRHGNGLLLGPERSGNHGYDGRERKLLARPSRPADDDMDREPGAESVPDGQQLTIGIARLRHSHRRVAHKDDQPAGCLRPGRAGHRLGLPWPRVSRGLFQRPELAPGQRPVPAVFADRRRTLAHARIPRSRDRPQVAAAHRISAAP